MTTNYENAYNELELIGCPVIGSESSFRISGEDNSTRLWADYYNQYPSMCDDFGVSHVVNDILDKNDLFAEWINPGVLGVYET